MAANGAEGALQLGGPGDAEDRRPHRQAGLGAAALSHRHGSDCGNRRDQRLHGPNSEVCEHCTMVLPSGRAQVDRPRPGSSRRVRPRPAAGGAPPGRRPGWPRGRAARPGRKSAPSSGPPTLTLALLQWMRDIVRTQARFTNVAPWISPTPPPAPGRLDVAEACASERSQRPPASHTTHRTRRAKQAPTGSDRPPVAGTTKMRRCRSPGAERTEMCVRLTERAYQPRRPSFETRASTTSSTGGHRRPCSGASRRPGGAPTPAIDESTSAARWRRTTRQGHVPRVEERVPDPREVPNGISVNRQSGRCSAPARRPRDGSPPRRRRRRPAHRATFGTGSALGHRAASRTAHRTPHPARAPRREFGFASGTITRARPPARRHACTASTTTRILVFGGGTQREGLEPGTRDRPEQGIDAAVARQGRRRRTWSRRAGGGQIHRLLRRDTRGGRAPQHGGQGRHVPFAHPAREREAVAVEPSNRSNRLLDREHPLRQVVGGSQHPARTARPWNDTCTREPTPAPNEASSP